MEYTIESRKGMQGETLLSVTIPEAQIDEKALYTMETERPDFLVPFHYRYRKAPNAAFPHSKVGGWCA